MGNDSQKEVKPVHHPKLDAHAIIAGKELLIREECVALVRKMNGKWHSEEDVSKFGTQLAIRVFKIVNDEE